MSALSMRSVFELKDSSRYFVYESINCLGKISK